MKIFYVSLACLFCFVSFAWGAENPKIRSGETITGTIESASSSDNWSFYGEAGDRVVACSIKTSGSMSGAYMKLYDKDASIEDQNSGNPGIDHQLKKTGIYTLSVESAAHNGTGNYSLTFQKIPGPVSSPGDLDGGTMTPGIAFTGDIDDVSDFDAYQFYGQSGDIVKVYALNKSGYMTDLYIKLYPPDGAEAESENLGSYGIDHMLGETGLYTALVASNNHSGTGKYDMVFLKTPSNIRPGIYNQSPDNGDVITDDDGSLSWDPLTGATGYDVFFGEDLTGPLTKIGSNLSAASLLFPQMQNGDTYYWRVVAHTSTGDIEGPYVWFQFKKDAAPPINGSVLAIPGISQVSLSWSGFTDAESGIKNYMLVYDTGGFPVSCSYGTQIYSGTNKTFIHKGLSNNTTYYYRLCATDNSGNISSGVTAAATPSLSLGPDLTGTWKSLVQTCRNTGKSFRCKVKGKLSVQNIGQQTAKASIVRFYLSDDSSFDNTDTFLKQVSTGKIKAGKSTDRGISYSFQKGTSAAGKYLIAVIDYRNKIEEPDEANNTVSIGPLL
jgi:hypothetical protein